VFLDERIVTGGRVVRLEGVAAPGPPVLPIATARFRRNRRTPARFMALPFSSARSSSSDRDHKSSSRGPSSPSRGCHAGSAETAVVGW
jgi:hypothetical protein